MLRTFLRFLSPSPQKPAPVDTTRSQTGGNVVLFAHVETASREADGSAAACPIGRSPSVNHRQRLMSMRLEHTRLCSARRCQRLNELGIVTAGDLATADPKQIAAGFGAPKKAVRILKQYRRAVRLAASVPGMMPRDAQLLVSIHRRSVRGLAAETPSSLHRDLQRFAESTPGRQQLRGRRVPSTRRIKRWIAACENRARNIPIHVAM